VLFTADQTIRYRAYRTPQPQQLLSLSGFFNTRMFLVLTNYFKCYSYDQIDHSHQFYCWMFPTWKEPFIFALRERRNWHSRMHTLLRLHVWCIDFSFYKSVTLLLSFYFILWRNYYSSTKFLSCCIAVYKWWFLPCHCFCRFTDNSWCICL